MTKMKFAALARRSIFVDLAEKMRGVETGHFPTEILAGLTVALALVPEAVAFAFVAGVHPLVGLYAAFIVGLITAVFGGRPGMISGATGALAVVMVALVADHGVEYLFATVVLMGLIQVAAGVFDASRHCELAQLCQKDHDGQPVDEAQHHRMRNQPDELAPSEGPKDDLNDPHQHHRSKEILDPMHRHQ